MRMLVEDLQHAINWILNLMAKIIFELVGNFQDISMSSLFETGEWLLFGRVHDHDKE